MAVTNAQGKVANVPVTVTPADIADAQVSPQTLEWSVFETLFGDMGDPAVTIDGETLTNYQDYHAVLYVDGKKYHTFNKV